MTSIDALARVTRPERGVGDRIRAWIRAELPSAQDPEHASALYDQIRNGLVHEARLKAGSQFYLEQEQVIDEGTGIFRINPRLLAGEVREALAQFVARLQHDRQARLALLEWVKNGLRKSSSTNFTRGERHHVPSAETGAAMSRTRWAIEIGDLPGNRRLLMDVLAGLGISSRETDGGLLLESPRFEALSTPEDVRTEVVRLAARMRDVKSCNPDIDCTFSLKVVIDRSGDKPRKHYYLTIHESLLLQSSMEVSLAPDQEPTAEERARQEAERRERDYIALRGKALSRVLSAVHDQKALDVQKLLHEELSPVVLGNIVEIIQADLGPDMRELMSRKQQVRLERSLNHPEVFGLTARHAVSNAQPPPDPMFLEEARAVVRAIAEQWLARKAVAT